MDVDLFSQVGDLLTSLNRKQNVKANLKTLLKIARSENHIEKVYFNDMVDLALCQKLNVSQSMELIKCLQPRTYVPSSAIISAISWICTDKMNKKIAVTMMRWMITMHRKIDNIERVRVLYDMLFHYLDDEKLHAPVAYFLALLSIKEDVKRYRLRKLEELYFKLGQSNHIANLLYIYECLVPGEVKIQFKIPEKNFNLKNDSMWSLWMDETRNAENNDCNSEKERPLKRIRLNNDRAISGFTMIFKEDCPVVFDLPVNFSFDDMILNLDNFKLPSRSISIMGNKTLLPFVTCALKADLPERFDHVIKDFLAEEISKGNNFETTNNLLRNLTNFESSIQEGIPCTYNFLCKYLPFWNCKDYMVSIFDMISWVPMCPFNDLYEFILFPLEDFCEKCNTKEKALILQTLTKLLQNLATVERNKVFYASVPNFFMFDKKNLGFSSYDTIIQLVNYVASLSIAIVYSEDANLIIVHNVLCFYELIPDLHLRYNLPLLFVPPKQLIEYILLSCCAFPIARLCKLFCRYKKAINSLKVQRKTDNNICAGQWLAQIKHFNSCLKLICNALVLNGSWDKIEAAKPRNSFNLPVDMLNRLDIPYVQEKFNLHFHIAFISHASKFLVKTKNGHKINRMRHFFFMEKYNKYLEYLKQAGLDSIYQFKQDFLRRT